MKSRVAAVWNSDPQGAAVELLRIGIGLVWALNLLVAIVPSNQFFPGFQSAASTFGPTTLGGPGFASFVASNPLFFAWAVAILTGYLAVAFLVGITTRLACVVGGLASVAFLLTQFASTFVVNGFGTDVGPHPIRRRLPPREGRTRPNVRRSHRLRASASPGEIPPRSPR